MLRQISVIVLVSLTPLSACASTSGSCELLALREYPSAFNAQLSDEIQGAHPMAVWPDALEDYRALRQAVRDCRGK